MVLASEILKKKLSATEVVERELQELRVLGEGGQGTVTLCRDEASGSLFALKTVLSDSGDEDLLQEFDVVRQLMDSGVDGIVPVHDIDKDDLGHVCVLMDYCNRGSLQSVLGRRAGSRLQEWEAAAVVRSVATTLSKCHSMGLMHRDIKADNVLVHCSSGSNKKRGRGEMEEDDINEHDMGCCRFLVSDFGLACRFRPGHHIRDGSIAGTTQYMAPEMLLKGSYDERADVWSLGVMLHLVLTGTYPPQTSQMLRLVEKGVDHGSHDLVEQERVWKMDWSSPIYSHLSEGARSVLGGMLRKKPRHRLSLFEICEHPWVQQKKTTNMTPARKRIRLLYDGLPTTTTTAQPNNHQCPQPKAQQVKPPAMPIAPAAPLVIRIRFEGNIIGEFRTECNNKGGQQQQQLLPIPLPAC